MLNIDEIMNGVVIDHITAGTGLSLYHLLELEKLNEASAVSYTHLCGHHRFCTAVLFQLHMAWLTLLCSSFGNKGMVTRRP